MGKSQWENEWGMRREWKVRGVSRVMSVSEYEWGNGGSASKVGREWWI